MPQTKIKYSYVEQAKLGAVLLICCFTLTFTDWLWTWDQGFYDIQIRSKSRPASENAIIVAIDETSLNDFGRWPWSRDVHALLIDRLSELGAKTIVFDVIFSEPDRGNEIADDMLAESIARAQNVILPVFVEQTRLGSQLKETLPLPKLIQAGAKLGHVHIELDADGIARSTFLFEGLGKPIWPHISLVALENSDKSQPISRPDIKKTTSPFTWHRAEQRLIPFLGPPGHFQRISYADIIKGLVNREKIENKIVFVGVTATGLGDALPTPVSGLSHPMPGIEINANIFASLQDNTFNQPMSSLFRTLFSLLFILLPVILFPRISPRSALILTTALIVTTAFFSFLCLTFWHVWFAPLAVILTLMLSYPLWSWRRLEFTTHYLDSQIKLLANEPGVIPDSPENDYKADLDFLSRIIAGDSWAIFDEQGQQINGTPEFHKPPEKVLRLNKWIKKQGFLWLKIDVNRTRQIVGLKLSLHKKITPMTQDLLDQFCTKLIASQQPRTKDTVEIIEHQILQVQSATTRLRAMRQFVSSSLDQMADGILVASAFGNVILNNQQSQRLFKDMTLINQPILSLLASFKTREVIDWAELMRRVIIDNNAEHVLASNELERDLLIQIAPLMSAKQEFNGLIVNFSDITDIKDAERKRTEYINFLSHDLRSPLSSAMALLELERDSNNENISRLKKYTEKALDLSENFVQLARADNIDEINFFEIDFLNILYNSVDQLWELANEKSIEIQLDSELDSAMTVGDAGLLERAFINLLGNAVKYSPTNTFIKIKLESHNNNYTCSITDQGYGVSDKDLPSLFSRYRRTERSQQEDNVGIGLGLAFVKSVIDGHHGSIMVESELNKGSTFTIQLPICY